MKSSKIPELDNVFAIKTAKNKLGGIRVKTQVELNRVFF